MSNVEQSGTESRSGSSPLPKSKLFWTCIVLGLVLLVLGMFVFTGPAAGITGVWAATLLVGAILGYGCYRIWYRFGM